ncbi:MAG: hypothetical protein IJ864_03115 [Alphaproteobacteria bacterium]|nr:hypothetical protein [Alphaproteobacteria bacterium]
MADTELDNFFSADSQTKKSTTAKSTKQEETNDDDGFDLEDEFSKLLNDFINQENTAPVLQDKSDSVSNSLDSLQTPQCPLESMVTATPVEETSALDDFAQTAPNNQQETMLDGFVTENTAVQTGAELDTFITNEPASSEINETDGHSGLKPEEQELARSLTNFQDSISAMANKKNLKLPKTDYEETMLMPNYKPSVGKKIAQYLLDCWPIINKYDPDNMKRLAPTATDEEYLSFAESLNDTYMQLAIISYVEILINMEICEVSYEQKKAEVLKNRAKRELYEEYMELQERKKLFIEKLKEKNFPIDAERLISNYFRVAQKDPDGSFEALTKNPATFSPIQVEKIHPKFFGLIKVTPEDGIKANQKIGKFIKNLKV